MVGPWDSFVSNISGKHLLVSDCFLQCQANLQAEPAGHPQLWCGSCFQCLNSTLHPSCRSRGPCGPAPLATKMSSKSCSFQAILREKPLFWANFGLRVLPWGQNSTGPPWPKSWIRTCWPWIYHQSSRPSGLRVTKSFVRITWYAHLSRDETFTLSDFLWVSPD